MVIVDHRRDDINLDYLFEFLLFSFFLSFYNEFPI